MAENAKPDCRFIFAYDIGVASENRRISNPPRLLDIDIGKRDRIAMRRTGSYFKLLLLKLKKVFHDLIMLGKKSGSDRFLFWKFCREIVKNYSAFLLYLLICALSFIIFCSEYPFYAELLFLVFCISGWICTAPWEKRLVASSVVLLTILDYHFSMHYRRLFYKVGNQALVALRITDKDEIASYLRGIFRSEIVLYTFLLLCLLLLFCVRAPGRNCKSGYARILPLGIFLWGIYQNIFLPYKGFIADWREQGVILRERANFSFHAEDKRPESPQHVFLVIGETHRHDHFDLLTNERFAPVLHQLRKHGKLLALQDIITCYQTTYFSVSSLLTRRTTDNEKLFFPEKGLIDLYKEAGYYTIYITYSSASFGNDIYNITLRAAHEYINYRSYGRGRMDRLMIPVCREISKKYRGKKLLVVIKMIGAHFHYQDRYTRETMVYLPAFQPQKNVEHYDISMKEMICNSYKNACLESSVCLNGIAEIVLKSPTPSMMMFISDHGCTNYDDGKNPFIGGARENYHIPCFFYFNDGFLKLLPQVMYDNLKKNANAPITNSYIFDTMVSLSGIHYPTHRPSMDLTSPSFREIRNRYVWMWNSRVPYDTLGK